MLAVHVEAEPLGQPVAAAVQARLHGAFGDPEDLGARYAQLNTQLPEFNVLGGCCGTDDRHVAQICRVWTPAP